MDWPVDVDHEHASEEQYEDDDLIHSEAQMQLIAWIVAGLFVAVSVVASVKLIRGHLNHFTQPIVQSKIVGILWMVPIYATDSWLSLRFKVLYNAITSAWHSHRIPVSDELPSLPRALAYMEQDAALYLDLMRDSYEGYVIYLFLALMIAYLGGGSDEKVVQILRSLPDLPHPYPFNKWCAPIKMGPEFIRNCKMATMQFVALKPLMSFFAIVLEINGVYNQGSFSVKTGYLYTSLIVNTSISYAFYYLVLFYLALGDQLKPYNPVPKFLCIKAVLFLSFWQSVVLAFLSRFQIIHEVGSWSVENVATGIQNLLICFEMCFVALAHHHAFPYAPYIRDDDGGSGVPHASLRRNILADNLAFGDAMRDFNEVMPVVLPTHFKPGASILKVKKNLSQVASKDLFAPENARLLNAEHEAADEKDSDAVKRGWKL